MDRNNARSNKFLWELSHDFGDKRKLAETVTQNKSENARRNMVAIPGGNQNAPNLQKRIKAAMDEAKKYPDITVKGVYYSKETPQDCAAKVEEVQTANPEIDGWAMIGSWSLKRHQ